MKSKTEHYILSWIQGIIDVVSCKELLYLINTKRASEGFYLEIKKITHSWYVLNQMVVLGYKAIHQWRIGIGIERHIIPHVDSG